jgi:DNA-binding NtrC family response regulator
LLQHETSGHYRKALELLPQVEAKLQPAVVSSFLSTARVLLPLMRDRWDAGEPAPLPPGLPPWAVSTDELVNRRPHQALDAVRPKTRREADKYTLEKGFDSYSLIRAELACGHGEAARRLLEMRRERGNVHFLDDFFLARAAQLAGDLASAARHFAAVVRACDRYDCRPALDFELRLACELSPGDAVRLAQSAMAIPEGAEIVPERPRRPAQTPPRGLARLVGQSAALELIRAGVARLAPLDTPVLITGETGTGKELAARAIHEEGPRGGEPFVAVNCGAVTDNLLESELFGHERGAFTGATRTHHGLFEEAGRGTILLDEIGDVSPRLQAALLRVLENGEIRPVGASRSRKIDCRIVAATNAELDALAEQGLFRKDLLFRLKRLELHLAPLRERSEDILPLAKHFLGSNRSDGRSPEIAPGLAARLTAYDWPGNVRELANLVERLRIMNSDGLSYDLRSLGLESLVPRPEAGAEPARPAADAGEPAPASTGKSAVPAPGPRDGPEDIDRLIADGRTALRRLDRLRRLFTRYGKLTRAEAALAMAISTRTATRDLALLCREGFVERVTPSRSSRTHYFRLRSS